jgi:integrase
MAKVLTQRAVAAVKPPEHGRDNRADGIVPGLQLYVYSSGKKVYRLLARIHGKQVALTVGDAALMSLAEARAKAKGFLATAAEGEDPREAKRAAVRAAGETVDAVALSFLERHTKVHTRPRSQRETERLFKHDVLPTWGRRPIASIDLRDVNTLLDGIVDRGSPVVANRVRAAARKMFNWAAERGLIKTSPFEHIKSPAKEISRDRAPSDSELALILCAADSLGYPFGSYFKVLAFLGQRREEVAGMRWSELNEDLTLWVLPRSRAKNDIEHQVPIAPAMREILVALPRVNGSDLMFTTTGATPISGFSKAKSMLDAAITELRGSVPIEPWRLHDLRRGMASGMARLGIAPHVVELSLTTRAARSKASRQSIIATATRARRRRRWKSGRGICARSRRAMRRRARA